MIFEFMEENNITNFGYVIKFEEQSNLSILLDNHELLNDIIVDSDEDLYHQIDDYEMCIVGVTVTDDDNNVFSVDNLDDNNISDMTYTITPLFIYTAKTKGMKMEDFVDLDIINMLFYDVLDNYIKERN
jgi:hypothetical protein